MRNHRGIGLVDAMITVMLLSIAAVLFAAVFPTGTSAIRQAGETRSAVALAQRTLEQCKELGYESLTYPNLLSANVIDPSPGSSPYSFTSASNLAGSLSSPTGTLTIIDQTGGVRLVSAHIKYKSSSGAEHNVTLTTLIADVRPTGG